MPRWRIKIRNVEHIALRLLALFMAVILWFLATGSPQRNFTVDRRTVRVEASYEGLGDMLEVTSAPHVVEVTAEGPRLVLPFQIGDVEAFVDVGGFGPGSHRLPVQVRMPTGLGMADLNPREVAIVVEPRIEREVAVHIAVVGAPAGGTIHILSIRPERIEVYGAASRVDRVAYVSAQAVYERGDGAPVVARAETVPVDSEGRVVEGVLPAVPTVEFEYVASVANAPFPTPAADSER